MIMKNKKAICLSLALGFSVLLGQVSALAAEGKQPDGLAAMVQSVSKMEPRNTYGVTRKWLDVAYADRSAAQKLDIFLPEQGEGPYPVILAIHGGGFMVGDKDSGEVNAEMAGLTHGYAVVPVNYRLSGEAMFPAAVQDLKAAVRFIKAHAAEYNLDGSRIAAWGDSAGGNLASMLGTTAGHGELEDLSLGNSEQDSSVRCVVNFFGPTDFNMMDAQFAAGNVKPAQIHGEPDSAESRYMGVPIPTIPHLVPFANPESYISKDTVPFFLMNGSEDQIVPTRQSVDFAAKLKQAIGEENVTYIQLQGARHGGPQFTAKENLDKVFAFLDKHLK